MTWDDEMPTWWCEVRWLISALWQTLRPLLTFWHKTKDAHVLKVILDHWAMRMSMAGYQGQTLSITGDPGRGGLRFHHTTQNSTQFETYELFISRSFHLIFLSHGRPWVTETLENRTEDKKDSVQFSHSAVSSSLQPHGLQHARLPCPSPIP